MLTQKGQTKTICVCEYLGIWAAGKINPQRVAIKLNFIYLALYGASQTSLFLLLWDIIPYDTTTGRYTESSYIQRMFYNLISGL